MIGRFLLVGASALALAVAAQAQPVPPPMAPPAHMQAGMPMPMPMPDGMTADFITKAAQSDEFERREGRLAEARATSGMVRDFATQMVLAHTETTRGLKEAIRAAGMTPPPPPQLTDTQRRMIRDLAHRSGGDFEREYIQQQVHAHEDALQLMQHYANFGAPGPIKEAAAKTAPLVQHHLEMARQIRGQIT